MTASFLAELAGPGRAWFQSLPVDRLAHALVPYLPLGEVGSGNCPGLFGN